MDGLVKLRRWGLFQFTWIRALHILGQEFPPLWVDEFPKTGVFHDIEAREGFTDPLLPPLSGRRCGCFRHLSLDIFLGQNHNIFIDQNDAPQQADRYRDFIVQDEICVSMYGLRSISLWFLKCGDGFEWIR